jgi:Fic family protein
MYIHERPEWPYFVWNAEVLSAPLAAVRHQQGRLLGRMEALGFELQAEALLQTLTQDVLKTSEIEGEVLDAAQVRSSLARRLGIEIGGLTPADRHVEGIVEVMLDATQQYAAPLTVERLFGWHAALFPTGYSGLSRITVGSWRTDHAGPMQVVSGPIGRERVHFEAPAAARLAAETTDFLAWLEGSNSPADPVLRAGIAHLWFVTLHPFDDGNGRIARAIADLVLARSEQSAQRFYSMSAQIRIERKAYYTLLERTQKGGLEITLWLDWFLGCLGRAIAGAEATLARVLQKARFREAVATIPLNPRQRHVLNRLLDGFEGKLTSSKWARLAKCSQDTALRDIQELVTAGILERETAGGRSTHYQMAQRHTG